MHVLYNPLLQNSNLGADKHKCNCSQVVDRASAILQSRGYLTVCVVGTRGRVERSNAVASFTNDPSVKVILLTTGSAAAGESFKLSHFFPRVHLCVFVCGRSLVVVATCYVPRTSSVCCVFAPLSFSIFNQLCLFVYIYVFSSKCGCLFVCSGRGASYN